jgi:hypothetical protein
MSEQMIKMISPFIDHLPDMDILFNENDESRVVIPWKLKQQLLATEEQSRISLIPTTYLNAFPPTEWLGTRPWPTHLSSHRYPTYRVD